MKILVTGSSGHLGEALMRTLRATDANPIGVDIKPSDWTDCVGSITNRGFVRDCVKTCDVIVHTATLHKPHVGTHSRQDFVDTNISGTLNLLEEAVANSCQSFIFTSTTSTFGDAMKPVDGDPTVWVTEQLRPKPKNIYGVTKTAAEDLCSLFHRNTGLPCVVLKTSRFFAEEDDDENKRAQLTDTNLKINELLYRRVDVADIVSAHQLAIARANDIGFDRFIISSSTPFQPSDRVELGIDAPAVVRRYVPSYVEEYSRRNWQMFPTLGRVYDSAYACARLGWNPRFDFEHAIKCLAEDKDYRSDLAQKIGKKRYHEREFTDGPYPVKGF